MNPPRTMPRHFDSLDALRGLAALAVVMFHWRHFYFQGTELGPFPPDRQPLYRMFRQFYDEGWVAVYLFFCLSGFIFYWLYGSRVARGEVNPRQFSVLRFSRLYPLHFATLLLVAAGQALYSWRHGSFFVVKNNDLQHFLLQLVLATNWAPHADYSFNSPIWSVSIEVMLYFVFFVTCRLGLVRWWQLALLGVAGLMLVSRVNLDFGLGLCCFFTGGLSYYALDRIQRGGPSRGKVLMLVALTAIAWLAVRKSLSAGIPSRLYRATFPDGAPTSLGALLANALLSRAHFLSYTLILFPLTIITLALAECRWGSPGKRLAFLGQISYSSYLLHFPTQLGLVLVGGRFAAGGPAYDSPVMLAAFFAVLVTLSLASYHLFERPAQSWLKARLLPAPAGPKAGSPANSAA